MRWSKASVVAVASWITVVALGCDRPQELPVVVAPASDSRQLLWRDAHGPLRGEVPWVLRTDVLGPETYLVVETGDGEKCARSVSFRVLAAGVTEYAVTLVSDLRGNVSWRITYGGNKKLKLFTCRPRPADNPRQACVYGGIPKPLFGELVGEISAELVDGRFEATVGALRFERGFPCEAGTMETVDQESAPKGAPEEQANGTAESPSPQRP